MADPFDPSGVVPRPDQLPGIVPPPPTLAATTGAPYVPTDPTSLRTPLSEFPTTRPETKTASVAKRKELNDITQARDAYVKSSGLKLNASGKPVKSGELTADQSADLSAWKDTLAKAKTEDERKYAKEQIDSIRAKEEIDPVWMAFEGQINSVKDELAILSGLETDLPAGSGGGGGGGGEVDAATAYLKTETRKTNEVERQFDDFMNRAQGYYGLVKDEESIYGMSSDQYYQDIANAKKNNMIPMASMPVKTSWNGGLSGIVRPSLPDYVSPDYRLNEAVGLPGKGGFNDPDYDENGMPLYAHGTNPKYAQGTSQFAALLERLKAEGRVPLALWPKKNFSFPVRGIPDPRMQ